MKNKLFFFKLFSFCLILLCNSFSLTAQDILWEKSYGGKYSDYLSDVIPTPDYGFILAGSSLSKKTGTKTDDNRGNLDYWVWKMDEKGELDWQRSFGGSGIDMLKSIALTNDGGFIIAGVSTSDKGFDKKDSTRGQNDFWILKLNAKGGEEWQKTIGGAGQEKLQSILKDNDGGYILAGSSASNTSGEKTSKCFGNLDYWILKLDKKGEILWQKTYGGIYVDELRSIELTLDGGYVVGGYSNSPMSGNKTENNLGEGDYWILKLDTNGNIEWQKTIGGDKDDQLSVIHQTYDKGYIVGGYSNSESGKSKTNNNKSGTDFWVLKLDEKGDSIWQETYNYGLVDILTSLVENDDHSFLIGGFAQGEIIKKTIIKKKRIVESEKTKIGTDDFIVLKISEKGEELWDKIVGSDGEDVLKKAIETRDGGYLLAGTSRPQEISSSLNEQKIEGVSNSNEQNQLAQDVKNNINDEIDAASNKSNQKIRNTTDSSTNKINKVVGLDKDSPLKLGSDNSSPLNLSKIGEGDSDSLSKLGGTPVLPGSGDKSKSFGAADFWVVKLKDKQKPKESRVLVEAIPNPATEFTNIIIGYDFKKGTATLVDINGRILQQFTISDRTVPIDLQGLPEGIYIVNIRTDVHNEGVKIIKKRNQN